MTKTTEEGRGAPGKTRRGVVRRPGLPFSQKGGAQRGRGREILQWRRGAGTVRGDRGTDRLRNRTWETASGGTYSTATSRVKGQGGRVMSRQRKTKVRAAWEPSGNAGRPHLCHVNELVQHLRALCRPGTAQHHDLHPAGNAVAEPHGSLQGRAAPHRALQNVAPQVLGLGARWASAGPGPSHASSQHSGPPMS